MTRNQDQLKISVCIATYCRVDRLRAVLLDMIAQDTPPFEVVVVDNDSAASAQAVVDALRPTAPFAIKFDVQPEKNISLTRNRTVALASGDWLAFIDDDERAPSDWLSHLSRTALKFAADGVLGPVVPVVPQSAASWLKRGRFYEWARMSTGTEVPRNRLRFGNVILQASWLRGDELPFNPAYGLTGGEDGDLLARLTQAGTRIVWCDEGIVTEPVETSRLSLQWLLRRSLRGGQDFARHTFAGRYDEPGKHHSRSLFFARAILQLLCAALLALVMLPLGRHRAAHWLLKVASNLGKLSVFWGWHYREYGRAPA